MSFLRFKKKEYWGGKKDADFGIHIIQYTFVDEYFLYQKTDRILIQSDVLDRLKTIKKEDDEIEKDQRRKELSL